MRRCVSCNSRRLRFAGMWRDDRLRYRAGFALRRTRMYSFEVSILVSRWKMLRAYCTRTLSCISHLYIAFVGCVMKTRPRKLVLASTNGKAIAWSRWKLVWRKRSVHRDHGLLSWGLIEDGQYNRKAGKHLRIDRVTASPRLDSGT